ncbi:MAG TPA: chemotaxis protein CheD [Candidatus Omnitrophota bacterium]|nr:chemotaxis protein CheD [Candidatus Omnitrophota bacterium]HPS20964.1 chemotaxis protein CheD [Candidatus Omnitrophota bacterium]
MAKIINVSTGEVKVERGDAILRSSAIGSCICVVAYDGIGKLGGIAHILLPGKAPANEIARSKYAADAIERMLKDIVGIGGVSGRLETCIVGAANVLNDDNDTVGKNNIQSVKKILFENNIPIRNESIGGNLRRGVALSLVDGTVYYTEGNDPEHVLWRFGVDGGK